MGSETYHEPYETLSTETRELHRAIRSLIEELEAVDWYQQRADASGDDALKAVLIHNKNEEIEHAMMTLEWIRRKSPEFDQNIRTYLLTRGPITEVEEATKDEGGADKSAPKPADKSGGSLAIGSLRDGGAA